MKRVANSILGYSMLLILFGLSTGFNLFTHICLMSGEAKTATTEMAMDCCGNPLPAAPVELEANCCIDEVYFVKFDFNGATERIFSSFVMANPAPVCAFAPEYKPVPELESVVIALPPPKIGNDKLADLSVFRI